MKYWESTYANFKQIYLKKQDASFLGTPDKVSNSGSMYWVRDGYLYRYANHWGNVATCIWNISGKHNAPKGWMLGRVKLSKMEKIREEISFGELLPDISNRLYALRWAIPTHRLELHKNIFVMRFRASFIINDYDKYASLKISPMYTHFSSFKIKEKNIAQLKELIEKHIPEIEQKIAELEEIFCVEKTTI